MKIAINGHICKFIHFFTIALFYFSIIFLFDCGNENSKIYALDEHEFYAQVQNTNIYLYESIQGKPMFEIPETFYVKLLSSENNFYKCHYNGVVGFVLKSEVQCVAYPPDTPYLNYISFRNYGTQSSELRTEPSRMGGIKTLVTELPLYESNFCYYGKLSGEEVVPNRGDVWYYCSYTKNNQTNYGYIYAGLVDMMTQYSLNPLDLHPIDAHIWEGKTQTGGATLSLPTKKETLVILAISLPIIFVIALLFKPIKKTKKISLKTSNLEQPRYALCGSVANENSKNTTTTKYFHQTRQGKKKDYYEL